MRRTFWFYVDSTLYLRHRLIRLFWLQIKLYSSCIFGKHIIPSSLLCKVRLEWLFANVSVVVEYSSWGRIVTSCRQYSKVSIFSLLLLIVCNPGAIAKRSQFQSSPHNSALLCQNKSLILCLADMKRVTNQCRRMLKHHRANTTTLAKVF